MVVGEAPEWLWLAEIPETEPVRLGPGSTVSDLVQSALADGLNQFLRFAPGVCRADDPENVHKSRVATRRMRSQLKSFSAAIDGNWLQEVSSDLGWLAGGLGAVRDADVMIQRIRNCAGELGPADAATAEALVARLGSDRAEAARTAHTMMEDPRCRALIERLHAAASDPPVRAIGSEKAADLASPMVSGSWRRLVQAVSTLPRNPADDDLHEVRIRAKRCRYTTEILAPVTGGDSRRLTRVLTELQGVLGDVHDSHCTQTWLRASARSAPEAMVAGMIIAAEARDHAALLRSWRPVWAKAQKVKPRTKANR